MKNVRNVLSELMKLSDEEVEKTSDEEAKRRLFIESHFYYHLTKLVREDVEVSEDEQLSLMTMCLETFMPPGGVCRNVRLLEMLPIATWLNTLHLCVQ